MGEVYRTSVLGSNGGGAVERDADAGAGDGVRWRCRPRPHPWAAETSGAPSANSVGWERGAPPLQPSASRSWLPTPKTDLRGPRTSALVWSIIHFLQDLSILQHRPVLMPDASPSWCTQRSLNHLNGRGLNLLPSSIWCQLPMISCRASRISIRVLGNDEGSCSKCRRPKLNLTTTANAGRTKDTWQTHR